MLDKQFDNIINEKLKDFKSDVPGSDWNVFSQKLKVAMQETAMEGTDLDDQLFDEAVKSKLAAADIDTPQPNWSTFAPLLKANIATGDDTNAEGISDEAFDAVIKEKLINPNIEIPQADWPAFAGILAGSMNTPDISDSAFDNAIQNKLQNNSMDIPTPNWNAFSQKLQDASLSDQELDSEVKSKLENYSTQFNESHWSLLRDKMIETKYLRRNLYGLKWFEAALAILLFMTFSNFIADRFIPDAPKAYAETSNAVSSNATGANGTNVTGVTTSKAIVTEANENNVTNNEAANTSNESNATPSAVANTNSVVQVARTSGTTNSVVNNNDSRKDGIINSTPSNQIATVDNNATSTINNNASDATPFIFNNTDNRNNGSSVENTENRSGIALDALVSTDESTNIELSVIDGLTPGLFNNARDLMDLKLNLSPLERSIETPSKNGWAIHAVIGNNNHMISTPQDTFVFELPYDSSSKNLNFDLRISKEFNQLELMTGIAYQKMEYGSRVTEADIEFKGELGDYMISNIRYDLIKIPIAARWNYGINDKFCFFADIGISANILASSSYTKEHTAYESVNPDIPKPQPTEVTEEESVGIENSSLNLKNYQKGIFNEDGASLKESVYGTLNTGIGLNYKFNKHFETYARGSVNSALGQFQIGPNHDTFTTFGLQLGLKYNLVK